MSSTQLEVSWTGADGSLTHVGTLSFDTDTGRQRFAYASDWAERGFPIGVGLPLSTDPLTPPDGAPTFGVFDDACPGLWGRAVLASGNREENPSGLGLLAAVADFSRQGSLRFSKSIDSAPLAPGEPAPVTQAVALLPDIEAFQRGDIDRAGRRRILPGASSQGGARPKLALRDDRTGGLVMAKYPSADDVYDLLTCEAVALEVARDAGLDACSSRLLRVDTRRGILVVDRFDRHGRGRLGYQSMHTAARPRGDEGFSYRVAAEAAQALAGPRAVRAVVARAALSMCLHDVDDHPWNMGFLRDADGWRSAPMFDVVPCPDEQSGTPLEGTGSERSLEQLLDLDWGLPRSEVLGVTTRVARVARGAWERAPKDFGLDPQDARMCERIIESTCDFDTVLDGREPRYAS
ncbi:serine/threonine-protein kinase HipA [Actinomyces ruminicola]|uniref:Serine/threonine-protein kinase HipA n=1 Tax=Actinomyces ruminicola TaxID=332524 RepID=A0A1H0AT38_9ACTO|nr:HipA domain-containing protein [Actinomyces ruminicola]SDN36485.1 serine/threonine-protein kinase HipA [Actinomyces ruminicola]